MEKSKPLTEEFIYSFQAEGSRHTTQGHKKKPQDQSSGRRSDGKTAVRAFFTIVMGNFEMRIFSVGHKKNPTDVVVRDFII